MDLITSHGGKRKVLFVCDSMITTLLVVILGDLLYGPEGQFETKESVLQFYWWKGMDQDIDEILENVKNVRKLKIN
jgi:hypothetical protein